MTEPIFAIDSVRVKRGARMVLRSASVWVHEGKMTVLLGRNGCGKSTLLRVGTGRMRALAGVVRCGGWRTRTPRLPDLARRGVCLWPDKDLLPVGESLTRIMATVRHHVPDADVDGAVDTCGLEDFLSHAPHEFSGGERRRAELAVVLARRPAVLLADEPFVGIMPRDREYVVRAFRLLTDRGTGILVTGHEVDSLFEVADDVIWMTGGTTHHIGTPAQASVHDQFRREYLGPWAGDPNLARTPPH